MSALLFDRLHAGLGTVLDLRAAQHALTASNLANAYTPGFRARFINFDTILADAVQDRATQGMTRTDPLHVGAPGDLPNDPPIEYVDPVPWAVDGNSVTPEREVVRMTENSIMYEATSNGLNRRLALLRFAASDGKAG